MTTIDKNVLLAVFMDGVIIGSGERKMIAFPDTKIDGGGSISNNRSVNDLHYHSDWNWLMLVVEKIENTQPISIIISVGNCEVYNCEKAETMLFLEGVKIEAVYNACVEFINWYNKNK